MIKRVFTGDLVEFPDPREANAVLDDVNRPGGVCRIASCDSWACACHCNPGRDPETYGEFRWLITDYDVHNQFISSEAASDGLRNEWSAYTGIRFGKGPGGFRAK